MKLLPLAVALACGLGVMTLAQAAPQHAHTEHAAHSSASVPVPAQRWATDANLRDGMGRVKKTLDELSHYEMGHMSETMALDRVGQLEEATTFIFTHCKLDPQPDAAMHEMLVPLLAAMQKLKKDPKAVGEVAAMRQAVANYPVYFDDPGWPAATPADGDHAAHGDHGAAATKE